MTNDDYLNLITSEHRGKPKFEATVLAGVSPLASLQELLKKIPAFFDVDEAVGVQLDAVGQWVGAPRSIGTPLENVYFTWDDNEATGWDSGMWKGRYDPDSALVSLPDTYYRTLIKAKIAANNWDGTIPGAYNIWSGVFEGSYVIIIDRQNMGMVVAIAGNRLDAVERSLLLNGYLPLKPEGVRVESYIIPPADGPLFVWDVDNGPAVGGWGYGQWPVELVAQG